LGDFNVKLGREDILKPTNRNESLQEISNDNGVRLVNFDTSKNLTLKAPWSHITLSINIFGSLQTEKPIFILTIF
jgi:hypothetical protein